MPDVVAGCVPWVPAVVLTAVVVDVVLVGTPWVPPDIVFVFGIRWKRYPPNPLVS